MNLKFGLKIYLYFGPVLEPWNEGEPEALIVSTANNHTYRGHLAKVTKILATFHNKVDPGQQAWKEFPKVKKL